MRNLSRNTGTLLFSNIGSAVLSFVLSVLVGRVLGKDGLGVYAASLAWVFPLSLIGDLGISTLMTREIARDATLETVYLKLATQARIWLGGGLMLLLMLIAPLLTDDTNVVQGLRLSAPLILITPLFGSYTAIFRARQTMWPIPWLNLGMLIVQVALTVGIFLLHGSVLAALAINTLTSGLQLIAAWWVWHHWFDNSHNAPSNPMNLPIQTILTQAWPFAIAGILAALQTRIAPILLERLSSAGSVGYYAAASRFVEAGRTLPNALFGALFPLLAAMVVHPEQMRYAFRTILIGLGLFGTVLAMAVTLFTPSILYLTYGADFEAASSILQVAMWGLIPALLRGGITLYWYAHNREEWVNRVVLMILATQTVISLWLVPTQGAYGAAVGILVSETIGFLLLLIPMRLRRTHE